MPKRPPFSILVAGAGPAGLLFAVRMLQQQQERRQRTDFNVRIVDAGPPATWQAGQVDPRVYALSRESQWLLGDLWPALAARRISPYRHMRVFTGERPQGNGAIAFAAADIGEPDLGHIVEDSLLRTVLLDYLAGAGVAPEFGVAVDGIGPFDGARKLQLSDGTTASAGLVVGADGADSKVRSAAGIGVLRKPYGQRAIVAHVATAAPHAMTAWQRFLPEGPLAFLPLADGRSSIVWTSAVAGAERLLALDDDAFLAELMLASAGVLGRLGPCSPRLSFPLELKHASRYTRPGIALIGDSAHAVHPLAGQGMNLGLRDAAILAETLHAALAAGEYPGDEFVLRRYARRQLGRNLGMQLAFDGINELFGQRLPAWTAPVTGLGMAALDRIGPAKRLLMRRALGMD